MKDETFIRDLSIKITNKLIELGFVPDCTDTNDESEFEVQDAIYEILITPSLYQTDYVLYDIANDNVLQDSYGRVIIYGNKDEAEDDCRGNEYVIKCTDLPNRWKEIIINQIKSK